MGNKKNAMPSLNNPFHEPESIEFRIPGEIAREPGIYEETLKEGWDIMNRPYTSTGVVAIERQHLKNGLQSVR